MKRVAIMVAALSALLVTGAVTYANSDANNDANNDKSDLGKPINYVVKVKNGDVVLWAGTFNKMTWDTVAACEDAAKTDPRMAASLADIIQQAGQVFGPDAKVSALCEDPAKDPDLNPALNPGSSPSSQ